MYPPCDERSCLPENHPGEPCPFGAYVTNNGKGWYIEHHQGKRRSDGTLRHFAWSGQDWCTIVARYWDDRIDAEKELSRLRGE